PASSSRSRWASPPSGPRLAGEHSQAAVHLPGSKALDAEPLDPCPLPADQGHRPAGKAQGRGERLHQLEVGRPVHRRRGQVHLEEAVADGTEARTRGPRPGPDGDLHRVRDSGIAGRYGAPAFLGARNDTLSSTWSGVALSGPAATSRIFRWVATSARSSDSKRARWRFSSLMSSITCTSFWCAAWTIFSDWSSASAMTTSASFFAASRRSSE